MEILFRNLSRFSERLIRNEFSFLGQTNLRLLFPDQKKIFSDLILIPKTYFAHAYLALIAHKVNVDTKIHEQNAAFVT